MNKQKSNMLSPLDAVPEVGVLADLASADATAKCVN